ncbi:DUF4168 domain-containing protein [Cyanobacterium sp. uoEpiScrs1]|uniref:DUF4168 domain-containing protein n=1 Tax=Cyanobacterium sp. uoEpiScrs1 TaxID=2976343 RepID=UPI00226ADCCC|nr:DUF4168 domain-containing protein [Cyanobacterium sp. uoEpiScrs1]
MVFIHCSLLNLNRTLTRSLMASLLALIGILHGCNIVPTFSRQDPSSISEITETDIINYARIVLTIESQRQIAYQKIEDIVDDPPPEIACDRPKSFRKLPNEVQKIAVDFCNNSKTLAKQRGLTASKFNTMTEKAQGDKTLKQQIQNAMVKIQQEK